MARRERVIARERGLGGGRPWGREAQLIEAFTQPILEGHLGQDRTGFAQDNERLESLNLSMGRSFRRQSSDRAGKEAIVLSLSGSELDSQRRGQLLYPYSLEEPSGRRRRG